MNTAQQYIDKLWESYPREEATTLEILKLADEAIEKFPISHELWVLRGYLILLAGKDCPHNLNEALRSFEKSVEVNPIFVEGWEEIGHFYDAVMPNKKLSKQAFEKASQLRNK